MTERLLSGGPQLVAILLLSGSALAYGHFARPGLGSGGEIGVRQVEADPFTTTTLYALLSEKAPYRSLDGGVTWHAIASGLHGKVASIALDRHNPGVLYAAAGGSIFKSENSGSTWTPHMEGHVPGATGCQNFAGVAIDPQDSTHLFAADEASADCIGGLWESTDAAATWSRIDIDEAPGNGYWPLTIDPFRQGWLYSTHAESGFRYSRDFGATWIDPNPEEAGATGGTVIPHPTVQDLLFLATEAGILTSLDAGNSWATVLPDVRATRISFAPGNAERAMAATLDGIYKTADGGHTWSEAADIGALWVETLPGPGERFLAASPGQQAYGGRIRTTQLPSGVWLSNDGGTTFIPLGSRLPVGGALPGYPFLAPTKPGISSIRPAMKLEDGSVSEAAPSASLGGSSRSLLDDSPHVHDIESYGAVCDGVQNDSAAIQAAIDTAAVSGGVVSLPAGTCIVEEELQLAPKVHLVGQGRGVSTLKRAAVSYSTPHTMVRIAGISSSGLEGLTLDGNRGNASAPAGLLRGVEILSSADVTVRSLSVVAQEGAALILSGTPTTPAQHIWIRDSVFSDLGATAILLGADWNDLNVSANSFADYDAEALRYDAPGATSPATGFVFSRNTAQHTSGLPAFDIGWGELRSAAISHNVFSGQIKLLSLGNATIDSNVVRNANGPAIALHGEAGPLVISNNTLESPTDWAIVAPTADTSDIDASIVGNRILSDVGGVSLFKGDRITIASNTIQPIGVEGSGHGILIRSFLPVENVMIATNLVDNYLIGIEVATDQAGFDTALVSDNLIRSTVAGAQGVVIGSGVTNSMDDGNYAVTIEIDSTPPTLAIDSPHNGSFVNVASPTIAISYADDLSGVDTATLAFEVNGISAAAGCTFDTTTASCVLNEPFAEGPATLTATVADLDGNVSLSASSSFVVDTVAPAPVNALLAAATEPSGGMTSATGAPGAAEAQTNLIATNQRSGVNTSTTVATDGSFGFSLAAEAGDALALTLTDAAGNTSSATPILVGVPGSCHQPPDPVLVANQELILNYDIFEHNRFLWEGTPPIQLGVTTNAILAETVAIVRGTVLDQAGNPLPGVSVSVLDKPQFGCTASRVDGSFDLAVNAGTVVLQFEREGFFVVQRRPNLVARELTALEDVVLTAKPATAAVVVLANSGVEVARGDVETDVDGTRQATLLVPAGATAQLEMPDGSMQPAPTLTLRIKEFTVGGMGAASMPGTLPAASAYTYAFEATADEADAAGAKSIVFSEPVYHYVENFLSFPAGFPMPVGYYDRDQGAWVAMDDGLVIDILSIDANGLAEIDVDGSGQPADTTALNALGFTDAERQELASLYTAGDSLWRSPIPHLSTIDCNAPWLNSPEDSIEPDPEATVGGGEPCNSQEGGSIIECQNQLLRESIPIAGTPFSFHYSSERVPGREFGRSIEIKLTPPEIPESLQRVVLQIEVAGRDFSWEFTPVPNLTYTFVWDGLDAYGREVVGNVTAEGRVGFAYPILYASGGSGGRGFGLPPNSNIQVVQARSQLISWAEFSVVLRSLNFGQTGGQLGLGWGGWSITPQHVHTPHSKTEGDLYFGDGSSYPSKQLVSDDSVQFGGAESAWLWINGAWALGSKTFNGTEGLAVGQDGTIYVSDDSVYKRTPEGDIYRIAGGGSSTADGIPAVESSMDRPKRLAAAPDGSLYIAEFDGRRVRRIRPDGTIVTLLQLSFPENPLDVSVGPDGRLYVALEANASGADRILRLDPGSGIFETYAGGNTDSCSQPQRGDGGTARLACLYLDGNQMRIAWLEDGSMLIPEGPSGNTSKIRIVAPNGTISTFMGDGVPGNPLYGLHYSNSRLSYAARLAVDPVSGAIAIIDKSIALGAGRLSIIQSDGIIVPGNAASPVDIEYGVDGGLRWVTDPLSSPPAFVQLREFDDFQEANGDFKVPSPDGSQIYTFSDRGRHLETLDAQTGHLVYRFNYDLEERLVEIEDRYGLKATITRDGAGNPTSIVAPHGQVTTVSADGEGNLVAIANPAGETYSMTYDEGGLLESLTDPRLHTAFFTYDTLGRLLTDQDANGGTKTLARSPGIDSYSVAFSTSEGRTTTYAVQKNPDGTQNRTTTNPGPVITQTLLKENLGRTETRPDGTVIDLELGEDPRFGTQSFVPDLVVTTPAGLSRAATTARTVTLVDPAGSSRDPANLETLQEQVTINGKVYTSLFTSATRTWLLTSPEGRSVTTTLNSEGEVASVQRAGLEPVTMTYDLEGRLAETRSGVGAEERITTLTYGTAGWLDSVTDAELRTFGWQRDLVGRPTTTDYPDTRQLGTAYDESSNLTSLDPPGQPAHTFTYDDVDLPETYQPPSGPNEAYSFNLDRQPVTLTKPSGETVTFLYDGTRRLTQIDTAADDHSLLYEPDTNQLQALSHWPDGYTVGTPETLTFSYDGFLPTATTWSGPVGGSVAHTFDNDFRVASQSVNGTSTVAYGYDNDSLLTQAGALSVVRDPATGWIDTTALGTVATAQTYNGFGEMETFEATVSAVPALTTAYVRDRLGRIAQKTETVQGSTSIYDYEYDTAGRLDKVWQDTVLVEDYGYDDNDNRITYDGAFGPASGTYDSQDRMLTYSGVSYSFDADGYLTSNGASGFTTSYDYDAMGSLRQAVLDNGITLDYTVDGQNRRVGKSIDGVAVQGFLYQDQLNPVAELDGVGNVVSRFVYGTRGHVPDYMTKGGATYRIVSDHLGSVRLVVDTATGAVAQRMDYDSFGRVVFDSSPGFQPFGFAGGLYDGQTGLVRFGARDYEAVTGRWTAKDPIGFTAGDSNLYGYVFQDPVNLIDPSGEIVPIIIAGAVVVWGVVEFALSVYDVYDAVQTLFAPCASSLDVGLSLGGLAVGLAAPGGGYGAASKAGVRQVRKGTKVYRVWGGRSGPLGQSWTDIDPGSVAGYRSAAGLPSRNAGRFVSEGLLTDTAGVSRRASLPLDGNLGGLPEILIPNPASQIQLTRVSGVSPPF